MLDVELSYHAKQRMIERDISQLQILQALTPPTDIKPGKGEKFIAKKNGVRVVYVVTQSKIKVVTVTRT